MPQYNESNSMQKQDQGVMPDPLMSALNAAMTQFLGGTSYNGGPSSVAPPRTMPGGMQMAAPAPPPVPEMNPMFHPQSPLEYDMGALFAQAMQGGAAPAPFPMAAMGEEPDLNPPIPTKKPVTTAANQKPQPTKRPGNEPKDEPKLKTPPPKKKRMIAEK